MEEQTEKIKEEKEFEVPWREPLTFRYGARVTITPHLKTAGCSDEDINLLIKKWFEPHRKYHSHKHLEDILSLIEAQFVNNLINIKQRITLIRIAVFHDCVYNLFSDTNEQDSAEFMNKICTTLPKKEKALIYTAILDTKNHDALPSSKESEIFIRYDLHTLLYGSLSRMISDEELVFKEYGCVDYAIYKKERGKILDRLSIFIKKINPDSKIDAYIDWFKNRKINIACFPGSFFPWHFGHKSILEKAEQTFDKVIIAFGQNPSKDITALDREIYIAKLKKEMPNHQVEDFTGMLTEYVANKSYPITIIKGLRNTADFEAEHQQLRIMQDMEPNLKVFYIVCDRQYEQISSSAIRTIQKINPNHPVLKKYFHKL